MIAPRAIVHQDVIRHPNRHGLAIERILRIPSAEHAMLFNLAKCRTTSFALRCSAMSAINLGAQVGIARRHDL